MTAQQKNPPAILVMRLRRATEMPVLRCKEVLTTVAPSEQEGYVVYYEKHRCSCFLDPLQTIPAYKGIFDEVEQQAQAETEAWKQQKQAELRAKGREDMQWLAARGLCHKYWAIMKRLLKEQYGLDWKSPAEMNPGIFFD